jgi:hypothetical protein
MDLDSRLEPDPVIEAYKRDIDRTLLRENLNRTVAKRLHNLVALERLAEEARRAGARSRGE